MRHLHKLLPTGLAFVLCLATFAPSAHATSMLRRNIVDLIDISELIVTGKVVSVTDGFADGVPYTEVTVDVQESLKGNVPKTYTFRQFGLLRPRSVGNGLRFLGVSPDGWPRFQAGEDVMLFLYKPAARTGLRTTVGLLQGKFTMANRQYENAIRNRGLFEGVSAQPGLLNPAEEHMLNGKGGPVPAATLRDFVKKAVQGRWIQERRLQHVH